MWNIGLPELLVLALVAVVVVGPDRLPKLARDAAEMLRTLRELATGAREQLRDELGPEFADIDLRNLNPRRALQREANPGRAEQMHAARLKYEKEAGLFARSPAVEFSNASNELRMP